MSVSIRQRRRTCFRRFDCLYREVCAAGSEIVISPDEGVIGTGLQFTFPKGMGQNQLGGIKAVVGVVERADVAIAFGLAFFFSLLVIITFRIPGRC